jgi:hypothetical protein
MLRIPRGKSFSLSRRTGEGRGEGGLYCVIPDPEIGWITPQATAGK